METSVPGRLAAGEPGRTTDADAGVVSAGCTRWVQGGIVRRVDLR